MSPPAIALTGEGIRYTLGWHPDAKMVKRPKISHRYKGTGFMVISCIKNSLESILCIRVFEKESKIQGGSMLIHTITQSVLKSLHSVELCQPN